MRSLFLAAVAASLAFVPAASPAADAEALAERLLAAVGGRAAWAAARATVNDSRQDWDGEPPVLRVTITMDFEQPRFRIETRAGNLYLVRVIDGDRHWRLTREGRIAAVPDATLAEDRRWYAAHVYRTLHRVARRDPALTLAVGTEGRLEVHEDGRRLAWYRLDRRGQPYRYGTYDDEVGSIFGPWEQEHGGIRHPVWVAREEGKWRALLVRLEVNPALGESLFARPGPGGEPPT
jgi:hypothetical protein